MPVALDPFGLIEAMTIAGYATGCEAGYLYIRGEYPYIRGEYPLATRRLQTAIEAARRRGILGADVMGKASGSTSSFAAAPTRTSAARRPRC